MEAIISLIQTFGFPIAVCAWFMIRTEKIINKNTDALNGLIKLISKKLR